MNIRKPQALILVLLLSLSSVIVINPNISSSSDVPDDPIPLDIDKYNISADPTYQIDASIWGDKVVWEDYRNSDYGTPSTPGNGENSDIYMYNLTTGEAFQITTNGSDQVNPDIWKNHLVWEDHRNGNGDIYYADLSEDEILPEQLTSDPGDQLSPSIHSGRIVFEDFRENRYGDIYMYDMEDKKVSSITDDNPPQIDPDIYGDRIVWADHRNHWPDRPRTKDIFMYDIETEELLEITDSGQNQHSPSIYRNQLTWVRYNGTNDNNIYLQNIDTGERREIIDSGLNEIDPDIYGERVTYHRREYDEDEIPESDSILIYDISEKKKDLINKVPTDPSNPAIAQLARPKLYENRLVWEEKHPSSNDSFDQQNDIFYGSIENDPPKILSSTVSNGTVTSDSSIQMTLREGNELKFSAEISDKDGDLKDVYLDTSKLGLHKDRYGMNETKVGVYNLTLQYTENMTEGKKTVKIVATDKAGHMTVGEGFDLTFEESPPKIDWAGVGTNKDDLNNETSFNLIEGNNLYFGANVSDHDNDISSVFLNVSELNLSEDRLEMEPENGTFFYEYTYQGDMTPGVKNVYIVAKDNNSHSVKSKTLTIRAQEMVPPIIDSVSVGKDLNNLSSEVKFELKEGNSIFFLANVTDANDDLTDVYLNLSEFNVEDKRVAMDPISGSDNGYMYELEYNEGLTEGKKSAHVTALDESNHEVKSEGLTVDMVKSENGDGTGDEGIQVYYIIIILLIAVIIGSYLLLEHTEVLKEETEEEKEEQEEEESDT